MKNIGKSLLNFFFGIPLEFPKKCKSAPGIPLAAGVVQSIYAPDFDQGQPLRLTQLPYRCHRNA
ncbi:hypothetical protein B7P33_07035 [Sediminicola luteus]|uniref:Uncharacterized protein n=1 Tax=Sediminicola luteus TaxID=319238 RepID=A0A2A4GAA6_9FLAO|nr:hypothetical protein B7P33_07035 [Sediminicola luteus]